MFRVVKILSILIVAALAVIGTLYDYKSNEKLNIWGSLALILIGFSGITAIILEYYDYKRSIKSDNERKTEFLKL